MKSRTFLQILGIAPAFLPSFLWAKGPPQDDREIISPPPPTEPVKALNEILHQFADEFSATVESCIGEGPSHSRAIKALKLPGKFKGKDWWLCLHTQTTHYHHGFNKPYEQEHLTRATLCVENYRPISKNTQYQLAKLIHSGGNGCGNGDFGIDIYVRTCTEETGETIWISTDIDVRRQYHKDSIHPLHRRVIPLFEQMTADHSYS